MAGKSKTDNGEARGKSLIIVSIISLFLGFIGGVTFTLYKTGGEDSIAASAPVAPGNSNSNMADDKSIMISRLKQITATNPDDADAWTQMGNLYFDSGKHIEAIEAYKRSLQLKPNNPNVLSDMGVMYRRSKQFKEALAAFDQAIQADPKHQTARFNKGIVLMHDMKDIPGAIKEWEALVRINPLATTPDGQPLESMIRRLKESG